MFNLLKHLILLILFALLPTLAFAQTEQPFLPTWKLLTPEQKRQFMAGYVIGWNDARKVTSIALEFIRENPKKAVESLESIQSLYDLSTIDPATVAAELDQYFSEPANSASTLSSAMSALKQRAQ